MLDCRTGSSVLLLCRPLSPDTRPLATPRRYSSQPPRTIPTTAPVERPALGSAAVTGIAVLVAGLLVTCDVLLAEAPVLLLLLSTVAVVSPGLLEL